MNEPHRTQRIHELTTVWRAVCMPSMSIQDGKPLPSEEDIQDRRDSARRHIEMSELARLAEGIKPLNRDEQAAEAERLIAFTNDNARAVYAEDVAIETREDVLKELLSLGARDEVTTLLGDMDDQAPDRSSLIRECLHHFSAHGQGKSNPDFIFRMTQNPEEQMSYLMSGYLDVDRSETITYVRDQLRALQKTLSLVSAAHAWRELWELTGDAEDEQFARACVRKLPHWEHARGWIQIARISGALEDYRQAISLLKREPQRENRIYGFQQMITCIVLARAQAEFPQPTRIFGTSLSAEKVAAIRDLFSAKWKKVFDYSVSG